MTGWKRLTKSNTAGRGAELAVASTKLYNIHDQYKLLHIKKPSQADLRAGCTAIYWAK